MRVSDTSPTHVPLAGFNITDFDLPLNPHTRQTLNSWALRTPTVSGHFLPRTSAVCPFETPTSRQENYHRRRLPQVRVLGLGLKLLRGGLLHGVTFRAPGGPETVMRLGR